MLNVVVLRSHFSRHPGIPTVRGMVVVPAQSGSAWSLGTQRPGLIQTLVIDRQPLFTAALGSLLEAPPLSAQVWAAERSDVGLEMARERRVHVVFCEVNAEPFSGKEVADVLAGEQPSVPVILLGNLEEGWQLAGALPSSAAGLFTKDAGLDEFLVGVRAVLAGHRAIGSGLMGQVVGRLARHPAIEPNSGVSHLSPTEREILTMIGDAASISAIATKRGITIKTVRNHLANIYRKLDLHGRTEAMLWAARMGLTGGRP